MSVTRTAHPASATSARPAQLTRRGRLVLVLMLAALAFALFSVGQAAVQAGGSDSGSAVSSTWVVQPGETLWVIAEQVDADSDPRETVARIVAMNGLSDSRVVAGQELQVPA